jgi:hypothetical protein
MAHCLTSSGVEARAGSRETLYSSTKTDMAEKTMAASTMRTKRGSEDRVAHRTAIFRGGANACPMYKMGRTMAVV